MPLTRGLCLGSQLTRIYNLEKNEQNLFWPLKCKLKTLQCYVTFHGLLRSTWLVTATQRYNCTIISENGGGQGVCLGTHAVGNGLCPQHTQ